MKVGDKVIMLDAWGKNPFRTRVWKFTDTNGVICQDERGMNDFVLERDRWRIIEPDLFTPVMPWERDE